MSTTTSETTTHRQGSIKVNTTDIFPIIKKWLYSEHDIFLRELISNATDAITKRKTLGQIQNQVIPEGRITVEIDKNKKTITITDNGIGMTDAEIEKYIAQLAFSGAEEFVKKMKTDHNTETKDAVIGKFGLGFYSAFMVADLVEIESLSMNEGAVPCKWSCKGDTDYQFSPSTKNEIGTTIRLFINDESKEFLDQYKTRSTLKNYCDFMPYPIELVDLAENQRILEENLKATKPEEQKPIPHDIINQTEPLWKKDPAELSDEDYKKFFRELFPMEAEPLFWLHLNIDHPFELKGILYFPKLNMQKPFNEKNIRLYNKQVFVSENIKDVVPEFLSMLKGAIDSSDIPLNVSRSSLQGDPNVKKISNYIIKKVAESLKKLFNTDRPRYEKTWNDICIFVKYGILSDEKFDEIMRDYLLYKNSSNALVTLKEYQESIPAEFKEKLQNKVITFEKNQSDEALKQQLLALKVQTLETDQYIDPHLTQHLEYKPQNDQKWQFVAIDAEFENIIAGQNSDAESIKITEMVQDVIKNHLNEQLAWAKDLEVEGKILTDSPSAAYLKVDQQMKRFMQMSKSMGQGEMNFPIKKTLMLNLAHPIVQNAWKLSQNTAKKELAQKLVFHILDLAKLSSDGLEGGQKDEFIKRSQNLLQDLSGMVL